MKKREKVPLIMQVEPTESGAACLAMVLAHYGKWVPLEGVKAACGTVREGSRAENILAAAKGFGLAVSQSALSAKELFEKAALPCIIGLGEGRFAVLCGFRRGRAAVNDPSKGSLNLSKATLEKGFNGVCLSFSVGEGFVPEGKPQGVLSFVSEKLKGLKKEMALVAAVAVISGILGLSQPAFSRVFLDRLLTGKNPEWLYPFLSVLTGVTVLYTVLLCVREVYHYRISGKLAAIGSGAYMWRLLRLPMEFFNQRMAGDLQQGQSVNGELSTELVQTLAPLVTDACMTVFYLAVMLRYSWKLALFGVAATLINLAVSRLISKKRTNVTRRELRDNGRLAGVTVSGMEMIENIKAAGTENGYFERWAGYQADANSQRVRFVRISRYMELIPQAVSGLSSLAVLSLGVYLTMSGNFTAGMLMAFQGMLGAFSAPAESLISAGQTVQEMRVKIDAVETVMRYPLRPRVRRTRRRGGGRRVRQAFRQGGA